jgi:hypothetical protein
MMVLTSYLFRDSEVGVLCLFLPQIALKMEPALRNNRVTATIL